ncbi:MAG: oligosaccharide flippase family protein, partial [Algoriphagus aquaeductus]
LNLICKFPSWKSIFFELKEGGALFGSTVFISIYTTLTPIILNVLSGPVAVGYYGLADKARMLVQSGLSPISQALFPRMSLLFSNDKSQARLQLLRSSKFILLLSASLSIMLWFFAEYIVILLAGDQFRPAVDVLKWLACLPFIISLSNIFGMQIMLPNQRKRAFNNILIGAGAISLIMIYPLIQWADEIGASVNTLITECFVTLAMGLYLWRKGFFKKTVNWNN